jgi:hypothetical protein
LEAALLATAVLRANTAYILFSYWEKLYQLIFIDNAEEKQ